MILHLDMDAFFASVEQMDNPDLMGKPVIIGGSDRGVVATASYEARKFGIHSAMPVSEARRLCPQGIFIHGRGKRYSELSHKIMACLRGFSPLIQPASIDEAYLDITGTERLWGPPASIAASIKAGVAQVTGGLTCSIGIAPIKFLAKICSDINKPDGVCIVGQEGMDAFLLELPVAKLPGVGKRMQQTLSSFGIVKVSQLRRLSRQFMVQRFGKWGEVLHDRAYGIDPRKVHENLPAQSEGAERTFQQDIFDPSFLLQALAAHSERISTRMRRQGVAGRTITLKIKFADFRQLTRSRTLETRTDDSATIFEIARSLLNGVELKMAVRLIGISVSGFEARAEQLYLPGFSPFSTAGNDAPIQDTLQKRQRRNQAIDALRAKFGVDIIHNGRILP